MNLCDCVFQYLPKSRKEAKALGAKIYYTGKPCRKLHFDMRRTVSSVCLSCAKAYWRKISASPALLVERKRKKAEDWEALKRDRPEEYQRRLKINRDNEKLRLAQSEEYRLKRNKGKSKHLAHGDNLHIQRKRVSEWHKKKREERCPRYMSQYMCRQMLYRVLRINNEKRSSDTVTALGYTGDDLREHLEGLFKEGMTWDNHGEWHIDHKKSVKSFIDEGVTDPSIINALDNLQPLWAEDNLKKGWK